MSELEITLSSPFRHMRKSNLKRMDFIYYYTQDKKWMNLEQAKKLIDIAEKNRLIVKDGAGGYTLSESLESVKIPLGFKPSDDIFNSAAEDTDVVSRMIDEISEKTGLDKKEIAKEMQEIKSHFDDLIYTEAAVIMTAKKHNVNYDKYKDELIERINQL